MKRIIIIASIFLYFIICFATKPIFTQEYNDYNDTIFLNNDILTFKQYGKYPDTGGTISSLQTYNYDKTLTFVIGTQDTIDDLVKENKLKNPNNIDYKSNIYNLPIENKSYSRIFEDFTKEKKHPNVTKDSKGNYVYDISPDTIIVRAVDGEITQYYHIDNRLLDTRTIINKTITISDHDNEYSGEFFITPNKKSDYNKYSIVYKTYSEMSEEDEEYYEK